MKKELEIFSGYLKSKGLKDTKQRRRILEIFLKTERHLTADELYRITKREDAHIGFSTVYRTLKLIHEAGLLNEVDFLGRGIRFEHRYAHNHHDHMICLKCGKFFEVVDNQIEELQERLAKRYKFRPIRHKMDIFGYCRKCK